MTQGDAEQRAAQRALEAAESGLFEAMAHGDTEHRAWLKGMIRGWFAHFDPAQFRTDKEPKQCEPDPTTIIEDIFYDYGAPYWDEGAKELLKRFDAAGYQITRKGE